MSLYVRCWLQWRQYDLNWILLGQHVVGACICGPCEALAVTRSLDDLICTAEVGYLTCPVGGFLI
jgi:hypothetical protein